MLLAVLVGRVGETVPVGELGDRYGRAAGDAWRASLRILEELTHDGAVEVRERIAGLPSHS